MKKYLLLPVNLVKFWYFDSLVFFARTWRHTLLYLEEDLAVGLMFKLLFTPLFHDASIVGHLLSFIFRSTRILVGGLAFLLATIFICLLALGWFILPVSAFYFTGTVGLILKGLLFSGVGLYLIHISFHPHKKVKLIQTPAEIYQASFVKKNKINLSELLKTYQVKELINYLEQTPQEFTNFPQNQQPGVLEEKLLELGRSLNIDYFEPEHFFIAKLLTTPGIENLLLKLSLTPQDLVDVLDFLEKRKRLWRVFWIWDEDFHVKHLKGVNRGWLGVPTPDLDLVADDLTRRASKENVEDFIGRGAVVAEVVNILSMEKGRNIIIVGEPGSGRTGLVRFLGKQIVSGDAPEALSTKRLVALDLTKLLTGVTTQGDLATKVKAVFEQAQASGNIILFVDEIQNMGIGEAGSAMNLFSLIMPYIEDSGMQFIATTDPSSYTRILEKNGSFARLFAKVELPPASEAETVEILKNRSIETEQSKKIKTSLMAIKRITTLTKQYLHDRVLPDSALGVFYECLIHPSDGWVKVATVNQVMQTKVNIPVAQNSKEQTDQLLHLEEKIHQKMIDQVEAVTAIATTLRRASANLRDTNRPIGSFLFVGPTGTGKTELAKTLADVYFSSHVTLEGAERPIGSEKDSLASLQNDNGGNFIRFDMSEYQTQESIVRLLGESGEEGQLTQAVREKPYSLLLLDEFEKADPKLVTIFLQVLDDGRLTSGSGRTVDFTNTIIIATSNAASLLIAQGLQAGQSMQTIDQLVNAELLKVFKPELVNRFDEVVIFKPLSQTDLQQIVTLKLKSLQENLHTQGYVVDFDPKLVSLLAQKGYDPVLGARPLRRLIQDTLEAKLSVEILQGKLPKGEKIILGPDLLA